MSATNGKAKEQLSPEEMKAEWKRLRVANAYKEEVLRSKQADLMESYFDTFSYANYGGGTDLYTSVWSQQTQAGPGIPPAQSSDRAYGRKWPLWQSDVRLNMFRQASRVLVATNDYAAGLLRNLTNSVIGKGFTYKVGGKDTEEAKRFAAPRRKPMEGEDDEQKTPLDMLADSVHEWLQRFMARNNWSPTGLPEDISFERDANGEYLDQCTLASGSQKERETYWRTIRDGDVFLRLFLNDDGTVDVRFVDPTLIWGFPPNTSPEKDGWSYGIQHKVEQLEDGQVHPDRERVVAYYVRKKEPSEVNADGSDGEIVPANEMIHIKMPGEDAEVKHGTPAFAFDTLEALVRAANGQRITSLTAAVQASTAEYWKHQIGTKDQIASLQNPGARQMPLPGTNGTQVETFRPIPAQVRRGPNSQEPVELPTPHGPMFLEVWKGDLQQAGAAFSATESMISGDADTATYAAMSEAGSVWVNAREADQEHFKTPFLKLMWRVVRWAVHCEKLPPQAMTLLEITVEGPLVHKDNKAELAQVSAAELQAKITSPQAEIAKRGNDPKRIQKDWKEWDAANQPPGMPGVGQEGEQPPSGDNGQPVSFADPKRSQAAKQAWQKRAHGLRESRESESGSSEIDQRAELYADILYGLYGDSILGDDVTEAAEPGFTGVKKDKLGRKMYYENGKRVKNPQQPQKQTRTKKGSVDAVVNARKAIDDVLGGKSNITPEQLAGHLDNLTVAQLKEAHKMYGKKPPGRLRAHLVDSIKGILSGSPPPDKKQEIAKPKAKQSAQDFSKTADFLNGNLTVEMKDLRANLPKMSDEQFKQGVERLVDSDKANAYGDARPDSDQFKEAGGIMTDGGAITAIHAKDVSADDLAQAFGGKTKEQPKEQSQEKKPKHGFKMGEIPESARQKILDKYSLPHIEGEMSPRLRADAVDVPLDSLVATQHGIDSDHVAELRSGEASRRAGSTIDVVRIGGKNYIWDGHHAAEAMRQDGKKEIKARLLDLDNPKEPTQLQSVIPDMHKEASKFAKVQKLDQNSSLQDQLDALSDVDVEALDPLDHAGKLGTHNEVFRSLSKAFRQGGEGNRSAAVRQIDGAVGIGQKAAKALRANGDKEAADFYDKYVPKLAKSIKDHIQGAKNAT